MQLENLSPYKFEIFQKREDVPPQFRNALITPFDPTLPVKCWVDLVPFSPTEVEVGARYYKTFKMNGNSYLWSLDGKAPQFKTIAVSQDFVGLLNIAPKSFTGEFPEIKTLPEILCPVMTDPPEGYEWFNSLGVTPTFKLKAETPVTLEKIYAEILALREELRAKKS